MESLILDTNALLRFLLNDIPSQARQVAEVLSKAKLKKLRLYIPQIIIFEIFFALDKYYKFPKKDVVNKIGTLLSTTYLEIEDRVIFQDALEVYTNKNIDFVDCFLVCTTRSSNSALFTFDKRLQKLKI